MVPEECIDKLEHLILDENELVTYKLLSKELKIHVNEAKKYLYEFLTIQKSKEEVKLYAHYFLSGLVSKDDELVKKIIIVSEDNLDEVKSQFKEITSCHIYSLNKGESQEPSLLFNCQSWCKKWAEEHREFAAIKHPNIVIQAPVIKKTTSNKNDAKSVPAKVAPAKQTKKENVSPLFKNNKPVENNSSSTVTEDIAVKIAESTDNSKDSVKPTSTPNSESKDSKKSTLSSLWQKLEDKTKTEKTENTKGKNKGQAKAVGKNNIMSMFSKQAERNASNPVKKVTNTSSSSENVTPTSKMTTPTSEEVTPIISPKVENGIKNIKETANKNKKKITQKKTKRSSKQNSEGESDEDFKPKKKKHRRICTMDDSDSDSENEEEQDKAQRSLLATDEAEDIPANVSVAASDDSEEPIPPTPPVVSKKGKKKVWKTIQKTFQDEDGFLVSKQEKVLVSGSESDEDPIPSKSTAPKPENKLTFQYRKQASLTSFFKQR